MERRKKVFGFIAHESKLVINAQMKQLIANMDNLERKHYEQKVNQLDQEIEQAANAGERVTMDQLMTNVGLSPRLKDRIDKKPILQQDTAQGAKPFEP